MTVKNAKRNNQKQPGDCSIYFTRKVETAGRFLVKKLLLGDHDRDK